MIRPPTPRGPRRTRRRPAVGETPQISMPWLAFLEVPRRVPGDQPAQRPPLRSPFDGRTPAWRPDGTLMPEATVRAQMRAFEAAYASPNLKDRVGVAKTVLFRAGTRMTVSTIFAPSVLADLETDDGTPMLWETMILLDRPRHHDGALHWQWRYASRQAALHGHRLIAAAIRDRCVVVRTRVGSHTWPWGTGEQA